MGVKGWNGGGWFHFGAGKYCFPSTNYKNKALAGQDTQCSLLISTSQEGTKRGRKYELMGVGWGGAGEWRSGSCFLCTGPRQCGWSRAYWPRGSVGSGSPLSTGSLCGHCVRRGGPGPSMPLHVDPTLASWSKGQVRA